jgi:protease YdgD
MLTCLLRIEGVRMRLRLTLIFATLLFLTGQPRCSERSPVDINEYPWASIGKLYNRAGEACTAAVVSPLEVVTAAHCLFNPRTRLLLQPPSLHFLLGYKQGDYQYDLRISEYRIGPNYQLGNALASEINDWAVLKLTQPAPQEIKPIPLSDQPAKIGDSLLVGGFAQSQQYSMTADINCNVRGILPNGLILHDCAVLKGDSGAPTLRHAREKIEVLGIHVASGLAGGTAVGIAVPVSNLPNGQNSSFGTAPKGTDSGQK